MDNFKQQFHSVPLDFDHSAVESPYYETSSKGDSLIELFKNDVIVIED